MSTGTPRHSTKHDFNKAVQTGPTKTEHAGVRAVRVRNFCSYTDLKEFTQFMLNSAATAGSSPWAALFLTCAVAEPLTMQLATALWERVSSKPQPPRAYQTHAGPTLTAQTPSPMPS